MKDRFGKPVVVKKTDFLKALDVTYEKASENYLTALINGLMIIRKKKFHESINLDDYKGLIQL